MRKPPPVEYSIKAGEFHAEIVRELKALLSLEVESCLDEKFTSGLMRIYRLYDRYQEEVLKGSGLSISCRKGCSDCCCHWVDDVYSFEAEIVAHHIYTVMPEKVPLFLEALKEDAAHLEHLQGVVAEKLPDEEGVPCDLDERELLLSCFYILGRPCVLVDSEGKCSVYPLRPLTCRIFVSFGDPGKCDPERIDAEETETCNLDLDRKADALLEELHRRFDRFGDERGLRALLLNILSGSP